MLRRFCLAVRLPLRAVLVLILAMILASPASAGLPSPADVATQASCSGDNYSGGALVFDAPFARVIPLSCAPTGALITQVQVTVNLDHECSPQLEVRLDNGIHSRVLQVANCQVGSGPQILSFTEATAFDGDPVNGNWKLTLTDRCRECNGFLASWTVRVDYAVAPDGPIFPPGDWPWYAQGEITIHPDPPLAGQPAELCVEVLNPTASPQTAAVQFSWAAFGIGIPFTPIDGPRVVHLPPHGVVKECLMWIPPVSGHVCIQVELLVAGRPPQVSQRNIDVDEPLRPGLPHERIFPVGNPTDRPVTITLGLVPHVAQGWGLELSQDVLPNMAPGEARQVALTVTPPQGQVLPPDRTVLVDVEAYIGDALIGGFRKIFRPPIQLHPFADPPYAEREITVHPYPPRAGEPVELCVELRNPTADPHDVSVQFFWAMFGIGLPFTPINGPRAVHLPPHSVVRECIMWIPPRAGHVCIEVELSAKDYQPQRSQRNIDVDEPLRPGLPHERIFPVGNPTNRPVTITMGLVPHVPPTWGLELSPDVLRNMGPGEVREVSLVVTPPGDEPLPEDGQALVDVEAYIEGQLIGGFRKIYRPPVAVHRPKDPPYAESEIGVDPYPVLAGTPTRLSVELRNPTDQDRVAKVTFSIAPFGIGLPFSESHILPNPIHVFVPAHGAALGRVIWQPPLWRGKFCVQVVIELEGYAPVWSRRNIDVGEPLRPGVTHKLPFPLGIWPYTETVTVTLGLVRHLPGWQVELSQDTFTNVRPGQTYTPTLSVTPPRDGPLGSGRPIVDVEAFVDGKLLGGFRKLDVPPIPIHKPHEKGYAESEITIDPYPPVEGQLTAVGVTVHNTSDVTSTIDLEFGWADFGMGIPFSSAGMVPPTRSVTLAPETSQTVSVLWTPVQSGPQCVIVRLSDPSGHYEPQKSQRNVEVREFPPCGETETFAFTVRNDSDAVGTLEMGLMTFNVPANWDVTVSPSDSAPIHPGQEIIGKLEISRPCLAKPVDARELQIRQWQAEAGSVPIVDVEAYIDGELAGGIEIRLGEEEEPVHKLVLPLIMKP